MVILPKLMYRFISIVAVTIPPGFFAKIDKLVLKLVRNCKGSKIVKIVLKKSNKMDSHFILLGKPQHFSVIKAKINVKKQKVIQGTCKNRQNIWCILFCCMFSQRSLKKMFP